MGYLQNINFQGIKVRTGVLLDTTLALSRLVVQRSGIFPVDLND